MKSVFVSMYVFLYSFSAFAADAIPPADFLPKHIRLFPESPDFKRVCRKYFKKTSNIRFGEVWLNFSESPEPGNVAARLEYRCGYKAIGSHNRNGHAHSTTHIRALRILQTTAVVHQLQPNANRITIPLTGETTAPLPSRLEGMETLKLDSVLTKKHHLFAYWLMGDRFRIATDSSGLVLNASSRSFSVATKDE